jgi:hypothetical protein
MVVGFYYFFSLLIIPGTISLANTLDYLDYFLDMVTYAFIP